jgi:hypothetical protein
MRFSLLPFLRRKEANFPAIIDVFPKGCSTPDLGHIISKISWDYSEVQLSIPLHDFVFEHVQSFIFGPTLLIDYYDNP